ncbi:hypothetical protein [Luteipulveratus halotolerans]|uniref:Uncharacterized protein n=1 Tax=Luteipulveratus halotolerans TaxID=1631356 RepID=A0A0L6CEI8_9MICO|nr:hypothetical protein [Luteipulveratus halotolerans]KNX35923.1 hypothetical protein VV01_21960 [Luteipulveratus halotolerans]
MESPHRYGPEWGLFEDWCAATGREALPTTWATVEAFLEAVPAHGQTAVRRLRAIRAAHRDTDRRLAGEPASRPRGRPLWDGTGQGGDLATALHHLPAHGFPDGVRARRDGLVLVLAGHLHWSADQISRLRAEQITLEPVSAIDGTDLPMTRHGRQCPSCALSRWLRALAARMNTAHDFEQTVEGAPAHPSLHDCASPIPDGWQHHRHLIVPVSATGKPGLDALNPRSIARIVAERRTLPLDEDRRPAAPAAEPPAPLRDGPTPAERAGALREIDELFDRLDERIAQALGE